MFMRLDLIDECWLFVSPIALGGGTRLFGRLAERHGWTRFVSMQDHLNLIYREEEREMLPLCREEKIGVIPYSPLASGRLMCDWSSESTLRSETDQIAKRAHPGSQWSTVAG
jgi:aryl-alcohol dehydrogenase-like predicted oxidoreductase